MAAVTGQHRALTRRQRRWYLRRKWRCGQCGAIKSLSRWWHRTPTCSTECLYEWLLPTARLQEAFRRACVNAEVRD